MPSNHVVSHQPCVAQAMNCDQVQELLSAFFDCELASNARESVAEHLRRCPSCSGMLDGFRELSALAKQATDPPPPVDGWVRLERSLTEPSTDVMALSRRPANAVWRTSSIRRLAIATAATLVIGVGWYGYAAWHQHRAQHEMTAVFGEYLQTFQRDPQAAQEILLANYRGEAVDADQAIHAVGYRPLVANGLPPGYTVVSTHVMKMPCCTCVHGLCRRSDGTTFAIFEHDDEETGWFADRPTRDVDCRDTRCCVVNLGSHLAATWAHEGRHITVVGVRDAKELERLVTWF